VVRDGGHQELVMPVALVVALVLALEHDADVGAVLEQVRGDTTLGGWPMLHADIRWSNTGRRGSGHSEGSRPDRRIGHTPPASGQPRKSMAQTKCARRTGGCNCNPTVV
jgi:hypothetical protein